MISSLYNFTAKGFFKALSFLLAAAFFGLILWKSAHFASLFGGSVPYRALIAFYGMSILWIHGIGFEIHRPIWRAIFLPLTGYAIVLISLIALLAA